MRIALTSAADNELMPKEKEDGWKLLPRLNEPEGKVLPT